MGKTSWTKEQIDWLVANYATNGIKKSAEHLGKSITAIRSKAQYLSLKSDRLPCNLWKKDQVDFLLKNYPAIGPEQCAKILNRTITAITVKAVRLKLRFGEKPKNPNCKICSKCNIEKPLHFFNKDKKSLSARCKSCLSEYSKQYQSLESSKEKTRAYRKLYYLKNKDKLNERNRIRKNTDLNFKLKRNISARVRLALKRVNVSKSANTAELVGCSIERLKSHLESQFLPGMTWENHGKVWEIDHIVAVNLFHLSDITQQKEAFNFLNLMPRFSTTDIAKAHGSNQIGNSNKQHFIVDTSFYHLLQNPS